MYYESGHTAAMKSIYRHNRTSATFPNWEWEDFANYDISKEKPDGNPQQIHDRIGLREDDSLFGWVAHRFTDGWLTCDDGSGEIADFIYLENSEVLHLIHVKGAKLNHANRQIAVSPFEVVVSQAAKNVRYFMKSNLIDQLSRTRNLRPAVWSFGKRVDNRSEIIDMLRVVNPRIPARAVVVQPHVSKPAYDKALIRPADGSSLSQDALRTELLESLLNITRAGVVGNGSDMYVKGSLF